MPKKRVPKSIVNVLFFVLIGLAFFIMWGKQYQFDSKKQGSPDEKTVQKTGPTYRLEPLVVELSGRYLKVTKGEEGKRPQIGTRKKYLSMAIDLELKDEKVKEGLEKNLTQIRDAISQIASSKEAKDIEDVEGKTALGSEIVAKLNSILQEKSVTKVFFAEFIIY